MKKTKKSRRVSCVFCGCSTLAHALTTDPICAECAAENDQEFYNRAQKGESEALLDALARLL